MFHIYVFWYSYVLKKNIYVWLCKGKYVGILYFSAKFLQLSIVNYTINRQGFHPWSSCLFSKWDCSCIKLYWFILIQFLSNENWIKPLLYTAFFKKYVIFLAAFCNLWVCGCGGRKEVSIPPNWVNFWLSNQPIRVHVPPPSLPAIIHHKGSILRYLNADFMGPGQKNVCRKTEEKKYGLEKEFPLESVIESFFTE